MNRDNPRISKKREEILNAATLVLTRVGYENASMDLIAEEASASKRTVYNHFDGKDALFWAVIERMIDQMRARKEIPYDRDRSLEEQLGQFVEAKRQVVDNPTWMGLMKVAMGVFVNQPEVTQKAMTEAAAGDDGLVRWLLAAATDGRLSVADPQMAAQVFWAMVGGAFFWPAVFHQGSSDPVAQNLLKDEILAVFLARYRS